ncbi:MAG TPA: bifunctional diguanylate cyclase/phosphodiesterase, partial [Acidimicrobiales bacterium]|nr:bifunctional diguanylate cyclase/phosphodiesterase [Acidimicrobiales bacterium]
ARTNGFDLSATPNEDRLQVGFEHGNIGMAMIDPAGRITRVNPALCAMLELTEEELLGRRPAEFLHRGDTAAFQVDALGIEDPARYAGERHFVRSDGSIVNALVEVSAIRSDTGATTYLCQIQDVTDWRRSEAALEHHALHDPLTGLANRTMLSARLDLATERNRRMGTESALIAFDLDRFQVVNDGLGHAAGDRLLIEVADRLVSGCSPGDLVVRFGSDEFIVVRDQISGREEADALANNVLSFFHEPFIVDGHPIYVSVSCGVSVVDGSQTVDDALRAVDSAMHWAKEHGGDQATHFDAGIAEHVAEDFDLEREIHFALERNEMHVLYQPILTVGTAELVGVEALVRWHHPRRGLLDPDDFIPVAERSGLIGSIGSYVLETALHQVMRWRRELPGCERLWVAVNLSSRQLLLSNPVTTCLWALASTGAPADALRLELTETAVMEEIETSISRLADLRSIGIKVAIDDFGTGHSSLSYLNRLPVGSLKVDQSFVEAIGSENSAAIVDTIVNLARALKLELFAEGVERQDQRVALHRLGCKFGQGFLWSKPLSTTEFEEWVRGTLTARSVER